jgi:hypothetical protein
MSTGNPPVNSNNRRWYEDPRPLIYVVVEVKCDGGDTRRNSMRSLAAIAVSDTGHALYSFSRNLAALEGASADQRTMALFRDHIEAWRASTLDAQRPSVVINEFATWVKSLPGQPALVASPLTQTSIWLDFYLRRFTSHGVFRGPFIIEPLFFGTGVDIATLVMGVTGRLYRETVEHLLPIEWRGNRNETHDVREDVVMHAELLASMLRLRASAPKLL